MKKENEFYLRDTRSDVGSTCMFWAKDGKGYVSDLDKAEVFNHEEAQKYADQKRHFVPLSKKRVDEVATIRVDMQYIKDNYDFSEGVVIHTRIGSYDGNDIYFVINEEGDRCMKEAIMTDLELLVREYPKASEEAVGGIITDGQIFWLDFTNRNFAPAGDFYPMEEIKAEYHRLSGKPTEWMDGANYQAQSSCGTWIQSKNKLEQCKIGIDGAVHSWFPAEGGDYWALDKGKVIGDWRDTLEERDMEYIKPEIGEQPMCRAEEQPTWNGEGLPPEGTVCEWLYNGAWTKCEIKGIHKEFLWLLVDGWKCPDSILHEANRFRPLRTEREIIVGEVVEVLDKSEDYDYDCLIIAEALYDTFNITRKERENE